MFIIQLKRECHKTVYNIIFFLKSIPCIGFLLTFVFVGICCWPLVFGEKKFVMYTVEKRCLLKMYIYWLKMLFNALTFTSYWQFLFVFTVTYIEIIVIRFFWIKAVGILKIQFRQHFSQVFRVFHKI